MVSLTDPLGLNPLAAKRIRTSLSSEWLTAMDWDPESGDLTVTMRGEQYTHYNVPQDVAMGLAAADSPGRFWHANIKGVF